MNLIGDKKKDNFHYQNIKYANKKPNASYTKKEGLKYNIIYYYCKYHKTTKKSDLFTNIIKIRKFLYVMGKLNMIKQKKNIICAQNIRKNAYNQE